MPIRTRRRWFQFSLRAMLLCVTLICAATAWVMYNVNWIRQRHVFLAVEKETWEARNGNRWSFQVGSDITAPGQMSLFGESGFSSIPVILGNKSLKDLSEQDREHILLARRLFPEARLSGHWFWFPKPRVKPSRDPDWGGWRILGELPDPLPESTQSTHSQ